MKILEKAKTIRTDEQLERFCFNLFNQGKDWLDLETLMSAVGFECGDKIYNLYEEWQYDS